MAALVQCLALLDAAESCIMWSAATTGTCMQDARHQVVCRGWNEAPSILVGANQAFDEIECYFELPQNGKVEDATDLLSGYDIEVRLAACAFATAYAAPIEQERDELQMRLTETEKLLHALKVFDEISRQSSKELEDEIQRLRAVFVAVKAQLEQEGVYPRPFRLVKPLTLKMSALIHAIEQAEEGHER